MRTPPRLPRPRFVSQRAARAALAATCTLLALLVAACRSSGEGASSGSTGSSGGSGGTGGTSAPRGTAAANATTMPGDSTALRAAADSGRIAGAPTAKVWMIIASDFQCPYCRIWHDQTYEAVRRDYVEPGKLRLAYLNYPLEMHVQAMPAAEAAMCASAQRRFWEYHSALFRSQERWGQAGDQSTVYDSLATATGLDVARFRSCTQSHVMRALILADQDRMQSRGVQSTPSFFIGSQTIAGAQPTEDFRRAIDAALAQAR